MNEDSVLDYSEFIAYAGNSVATEHAFQAMDLNRDTYVTQKEIVDTIQMLQTQSTEGTEDIPDENSDLESHNQGEDVPGTQAEPIANGPTQYGEDTHQSDSNFPGSDTGTVLPPPSGDPDLTVSAYTTPGDLYDAATPDPDADEETNENAVNMLSGTCV